MTDVRLPSSPQPTASSPLDIERSVTTTWGARLAVAAAPALSPSTARSRDRGGERTPRCDRHRAPGWDRRHRGVAVVTTTSAARERRRVGDDRSARPESGEAGVDALLQARRRRGRSPPRRRRAPRRSTSPAGCRGTAGSAPPATSRRARGHRRRRRPARRSRSTAPPRAAAARTGGCRAWSAAGW